MTTATRAVLYSRVSSQEQASGYSLDTQLEAMRRYCAERGYAVVGEFSDAHSGTELDRPGMSALLEAAASLRPEVVVVYDVDRLGREIIVQAILERDLGSLGARVEYVLGGDSSSPDGELLKTIKGALAVFENRQRVERSRRGKRGRAQAGHVIVSRPPFGYDYVSQPHGGALVINEEEAAVVELLFDWLIDERLSSYAIAQRLWARQIPHRGGVVDWTPAMVQKLLRNPVYRGTWAYGRTRRTKVNGTVRHVPVPQEQWIWVDVPAIITPDRWDEAQRVLEENRRLARRNAKRDYLLSGMVYCACGWRRVGKVNGGIGYYVCHRASERAPWFERCGLHGLRQDGLEAAVWDYTVQELLHPDRLIAEVQRQMREQQAVAERRARRLKIVAKELADIDRKLGQLLTKQLDGYPEEVIVHERGRLLTQRGTLTAEAERLQAEQTERDITPDLVAAMQELAATIEQAAPYTTPEEKRQLLRLLRIRVDVIDTDHVRVSGLVTPDIVRVTSRWSSGAGRWATCRSTCTRRTAAG